MPYLSFITDEKLEAIVSALLHKGTASIEKSNQSFSRNVIDPFSVLFEMSIFDMDAAQWEKNEKMRQAQKSLSNHIGHFHQSLLGSFSGWECLSSGGIIDLICHEKKIIAEIKNKHNTLKGSDKSSMYYKLEDLVMKKGQIYKDYVAYYVEIIPKKNQRYDLPFTPADASRGAKCSSNPLVRIIDGYSFYALVTGVDDALEQIFNALPLVLARVKQGFVLDNQELILKYFQQAFLPYRETNCILSSS